MGSWLLKCGREQTDRRAITPSSKLRTRIGGKVMRKGNALFSGVALVLIDLSNR